MFVGSPTPPLVSEPKKHKRLRIVSVHASTLMGRPVVLVFRCNRIIQKFPGSVDEMMRWSWDFLQRFTRVGVAVRAAGVLNQRCGDKRTRWLKANSATDVPVGCLGKTSGRRDS